MLDTFGVNVHQSTIYRSLKQRGLSMKVVRLPILLRKHRSPSHQPMKVAREANTQLQDQYLDKLLAYKRRSLVFIDESSFDRREAIRKRAWGKVGKRVICKVPFLRGRR